MSCKQKHVNVMLTNKVLLFVSQNTLSCYVCSDSKITSVITVYIILSNVEFIHILLFVVFVVIYFIS